MKEFMIYPWRSYLSTIINQLIPARCLSCRSRNYYLCPNCRALIPKSDQLEIPDTEAVFDYRDTRIKQAIWQLKYRGAQAVSFDLVQSLYTYYADNLVDWKSPHLDRQEHTIVIPIPMTKKRQKERGFNQAQSLAKHFANFDCNNLQLQENILIKNRETLSQMKTRNRNTRLNNLQGAFTVSELEQNKVEGKDIILIDDVITTGATIAEARRVLLLAGARKVFALAVAHG